MLIIALLGFGWGCVSGGGSPGLVRCDEMLEWFIPVNGEGEVRDGNKVFLYAKPGETKTRMSLPGAKPRSYGRPSLALVVEHPRVGAGEVVKCTALVPEEKKR